MPSEFFVFLIACFVAMVLGAFAGREFVAMKRHRVPGADGHDLLFSPSDLIAPERYSAEGLRHRKRGMKWMALAAAAIAAGTLFGGL